MWDALKCHVNSIKIKCKQLQSLKKGKGDGDGGGCEVTYCQHQQDYQQMEVTLDKTRLTLQWFPNLAKSNLWLALDPMVRNMKNLSLEIHLI